MRRRWGGSGASGAASTELLLTVIASDLERDAPLMSQPTLQPLLAHKIIKEILLHVNCPLRRGRSQAEEGKSSSVGQLVILASGNTIRPCVKGSPGACAHKEQTDRQTDRQAGGWAPPRRAVCGLSWRRRVRLFRA